MSVKLLIKLASLQMASAKIPFTFLRFDCCITSSKCKHYEFTHFIGLEVISCWIHSKPMCKSFLNIPKISLHILPSPATLSAVKPSIERMPARFYIMSESERMILQIDSKSFARPFHHQSCP